MSQKRCRYTVAWTFAKCWTDCWNLFTFRLSSKFIVTPSWKIRLFRTFSWAAIRRDSFLDSGALCWFRRYRPINCVFVCLFTYLPFLLPYFLISLYCLPYLFTSLLVYFLAYLSTFSRIGPFRFQTGGHKRRPNVALVFCVFILCCSMFCYGCMFVFAVLGLVLSVLSQEIGWEERLRNDLFCVSCDVEP